MKEMVAKHMRARLSAQKTRLVADMIRGKHVASALEILAFSPHKAALLLRKVLESAIANAESQEGYDVDELSVLSVYVDRGPFLKRFMARAKGRGARILKPTCNIRIAVGRRVG